MGSMEEMRILVTGGTGFLGSHIVKRLTDNKADVLILDVKDMDKHSPAKADFRLNICDLARIRSFRDVVANFEPEVVFHTAAYVNATRKTNIIGKLIRNNLIATANLLRVLERSDIGCMIYTGTCEQYGNIRVPFKETCVVKPISPYGISKHAAEMVCRMYYELYAFPVIIFRLFPLYGPYMGRRGIIPETILSCLRGVKFKLTGGEQVREYNYVEDVVDAYLLALANNVHLKGEVLNIGNGRGIKIKEIVKLIISIIGKGEPVFGAIPYRPGEIWRMYCDNTKARELLGWKPKTSLEEGLKKTINWYNKYLKFYGG